MDTQRMVEAVRFGMAVTITYDPSAKPDERWLAYIGFDAYGAGRTPEEALDNAIEREIFGSEPVCHDVDEPEPLPLDDSPIAVTVLASCTLRGPLRKPLRWRWWTTS